MFDLIVEALSDYRVILEPDENTPQWWAGAPSVVRGDSGEFYLAARMREGNSPRGYRGYEVRILRSSDCRSFECINRITREAAGVPVFERPCLVRHPGTGQYRLYGCSGLPDGWAILRFDDVDDPRDFQPASARPVLKAQSSEGGFAQVVGYKDPVIFWDGEQWQMLVIGHDSVERIHHFTSADGEHWDRAGRNPVLENAGWHNFYTRPASVVPLTVGYLLVYEGSHMDWRDPAYNIATGLAFTPDLDQVLDLTPDQPLLKSTTPGEYHTWRYSHWLPVGDQVYVYFEAARPNNTNEIRLGVFAGNVLNGASAKAGRG
jgi:hypothetical protein